ncbi:hypothetical protein GQ54DRAFT_204302 [Martensiomyces pterosporus]|nr:hypothetical protein GQ54DRAFT_204302 [Martensiomyces pterosporus]
MLCLAIAWQAFWPRIPAHSAECSSTACATVPMCAPSWRAQCAEGWGWQDARVEGKIGSRGNERRWETGGRWNPRCWLCAFCAKSRYFLEPSVPPPWCSRLPVLGRAWYRYAGRDTACELVDRRRWAAVPSCFFCLAGSVIAAGSSWRR